MASRKRRHAATASLAVGRLRRPADEAGASASLEPVRLGRILDDRGRMAELRGRLFGGVGLEDPGLRLDHLAERPVGDALAVGEASALAPETSSGRRPRLRNSQISRLLPTPGLAGDGDELDARLGARPSSASLKRAELALAADERRRRALVDVDAEPAAGGERPPHGLPARPCP